MQVESILIVIGWFIQASFQLECIQCTSPIQRVSSDWDHACLDGTLAPVLCEQTINKTKLPFKNCLSALYRLAVKSSGGVHIHRGCSMIATARHECDPPATNIDLDTTPDFFCSRTCSENGCNQHSVRDISSNGSEDLSSEKILLLISLIIWTQIYLFSIE